MKALLDANVLHPAPLRDLLLSLASEAVFSAHWTDQIHDEWTRNVLRDRPELSRERLERTRARMNLYAVGALVGGYEDRIPTLVLPDPDDRHVLAAALHVGAERIVTFNLKDFPAKALEPMGVLAQHPDLFVLERLEADTDRVLDALRRQRERLVNPPSSAVEFIETLRRQGLTRTAAALGHALDHL